MRNIVEYPLTAEEVTTTLRTATDEYIKAHQGQIGGIESLALYYLNDFLKKDPIALQRLTMFLDQTQPKAKPPDTASQLSNDELQDLWSAAYQINGQRYVHSAVYRGISKGGSATYDINDRGHNGCRLYIRLIDGKLRGEINEENFTLRPLPPPGRIVKESSFPSNPDSKSSLWKRMRAWWAI